ncbi:hypothetical protein AB0B71_28770 [Micromonospora echinofusca]|uniref:hypothetical protein n=1 Tax=Micromonospora echinofusca TaxID=47858 RepID=UPI0033F353E8
MTQAQFDFEQAWASRIPARWRWTRNKELLAESQAVTADGSEELLSVSHLTGITPKSEKHVTMTAAENLDGYRLVETGDLVINTMWAWMGALGVARQRGIVSPAYGVYSPRPDAPFNPAFYDYLYRSRPYVMEMTRLSRGIWSSRLRLYPDVFLRMAIPVPPPDEQRAIADYLDRETARIDTLIEEQQSLIEMLRERRAAVVDAALAPLNSWTRTTLKHLLSGIDQGVSPQAEAGLADEPGTWGVLKTGCVNRGVFRPEEHKRLPSDFAFDPAIAVEVGDVIVSRASGSPDLVGSAAIVERLDYQLILSDKLFRLRAKQSVEPRFLVWSLNSGQYRVQVGHAISGAEGLANNLPLSKLRAFETHHPSLEEQRRIATHLDEQTTKIDTLVEETERFIELACERRAALITAAVTGQIDIQEMA